MEREEEEKFLRYWEENRVQQSGFLSKLLRGLPMACLFGLPILLLIAAAYFFFPNWYTRISDTSADTFLVVFIAVFIAVFFFAVLRMHFKWEMNEQLYKELIYKKKKRMQRNERTDAPE